jgi:hypothetical protein
MMKTCPNEKENHGFQARMDTDDERVMETSFKRVWCIIKSENRNGTTDTPMKWAITPMKWDGRQGTDTRERTAPISHRIKR